LRGGVSSKARLTLDARFCGHASGEWLERWMPQGDANRRDVKKVVLAYSGGLDTSIILKWLQTTYGCEVVTFTADLGQGEELAPAREKALLLGIKPQNIFIEDLREEFVRDYVFPMFRANAL
jgi:argininosuccinate synthase